MNERFRLCTVRIFLSAALLSPKEVIQLRSQAIVNEANPLSDLFEQTCVGQREVAKDSIARWSMYLDPLKAS